MKLKRITRAVAGVTTIAAWVIFVIASVILVIDSYLALRYGPSGTISGVLIAWSKTYPIIPFIFGFLMGHLFFSDSNVT